MAGDWIKMQGNLWTSPKVVRLMSALQADKCLIVGALFRVWCLFDEHTEDGKLEGYTKFLLDDEVRITGFCDALESVGWLIDLGDDGLQVPDFNEHMSKSAKRRAQDTKRKRDNRNASASDADKKRTREEKRREDIYRGKDSKSPPKTTRFKKPTIEEIKNYCESRGNQINPIKFFDHYESNGWVRGKTKIKDWKACVRTWEQNQTNEPKQKFVAGDDGL